MEEGSSGKWYTNHAVIAAIITGVFTVIVAFINKKNDTPVQSLPPPQVSTTTTVLVTPAPSLPSLPDAAENDMMKTMETEQAVIRRDIIRPATRCSVSSGAWVSGSRLSALGRISATGYGSLKLLLNRLTPASARVCAFSRRCLRS